MDQKQGSYQKPKVLVVDDEEAILSTTKRLFRNSPFELFVSQSALEAIQLAQQNDFWAVVSDFKMPEMTGTQLLSEFKRTRPLATRIMLTGILEPEIVQNAINEAGVFRFASKPWDDSELRLAIEAGIAHSFRSRQNQRLLQEVASQNAKLEELNLNLEEQVNLRTKSIEESKVEAEEKQKAIKNLVGFIKDLSTVKNFDQLQEVIEQDSFRFLSVSPPLFLVFEESDHGVVFNPQIRAPGGENVSLNDEFLMLNIRRNNLADMKFWAKHNLRFPRQILAVPIRGREPDQKFPAATLFYEHDLEGKKLDNLVEWVSQRIQPISVVVDRLQLERALEQGAKEWEATFDHFPEPLAVIDSREKVIRANKNFTREQKSKCFESFAGNHSICDGCVMPKAFATGLAQNGFIKDSQGRTYKLNSFPVLSENSKHNRVVNYYVNASRERELYFKLVQSEKLAAVGLLAGNIAHELSNPLAGIKALAQLLKKQSDPTQNFYQDLSEVEKATDRCQGIIQNLLRYSQASETTTDLNQCVQETMPLLKTALRAVNLHMELATDVPVVQFYFSQLQQVVFNLVQNACQAMGDGGGTLTVKTYSKGAEVFLSVIDTGGGIPIEIQKKIFDPFFTTKAEGVGTGLGLSVSRSILEAQGGRIEVESVLNEGSTFTVVLPAGKMRE